MATRLRLLGPDDRAAVETLLAQRPIENLFLAAKVALFGVDRRRLGKMHGFERDGALTAVCLNAGTVFPAGMDPDAIPAFVKDIGPVRRASSILGPSMSALGLFIGLAERWPGAWGSYANVRSKQPLMVRRGAPGCDADPRVRQLTMRDFESYLAASVHMYTEEIGSSPYKYGPGYESFVAERLKNNDAWGIVENSEVIFKADLGPKLRDHAQLQGVWVHPDHRGKGLSVPGLSGMLQDVCRIHNVVSLYVNDFNTAAIRSYEHLGFEHVGSLSTVHY